MPYRVNAELPESVQNNLSENAQNIYREAFNRAYAAYAGEGDRERRSHIIAWAAVKKQAEDC